MPILVRAVQALRFKTVSIELLVSIASIGACVIGEFNESAIVTFLFQFGSFLEQKTMKKTRSAIKALTEMAPSTAWRITNAGEDGTFETEEIETDEVEIGDILLVKAGNQVASDGIVTKGEGYAVEASITGEPLAKHKQVGDAVYAGTILDSGTVQMQATKVGEDTTFAKIIALVEEAQDAKSPVERFIDRFAKYYTPAVIVIAAADTGIAMGSGTDVAIDNSDVVLIKSDLESLVQSLQLSRRTVRILYENIAIAVGTVLLLLIGLFAGYIHMSLGMLIHEASILVVIFNAMRLLIPSREKKESRT